jgi:hypothetical protein
MTGITTTEQSHAATVEQLAVPRALISATEPFRLATKLSGALDGADWIKEVVRVDRKGQLLCLKNVSEAERWCLGDQAKRDLRSLPPLADVMDAHRAIRLDLTTEPPIENRVELVCLMLDAHNITASDAYVQMLAWKLGDIPQRKTETVKRNQPWFSMVTITRAIVEVVTTLRPEYGRPAAIADVLDVAGRHASDLTSLDRSIVTLANTIGRLNRIVGATKDAKEAEMDETDEMDIPF